MPLVTVDKQRQGRSHHAIFTDYEQVSWASGTCRIIVVKIIILINATQCFVKLSEMLLGEILCCPYFDAGWFLFSHSWGHSIPFCIFQYQVTEDSYLSHYFSDKAKVPIDCDNFIRQGWLLLYNLLSCFPVEYLAFSCLWIFQNPNGFIDKNHKYEWCME